ncbi:MAG: hypothetical protein E7384_05755 [Ruminococcaceae bacterium]|nr:hypothetical protein [Oscillospiraceae bacterium]
MIKHIDEKELSTRIFLNYKRLAESSYYQIDEVFAPEDYSWPADKEGRALLSFVSHYKINGKKIPCMEEMLEKFPSKLNEKGYMGTTRTDVIVEQQLSGHSWLLRGLCEYYEQFSGDSILDFIKNITENLFMRTKGSYSTYPIDRSESESGGVSGSEIGYCDNWLLSTDVGCAFMSIDGLSHTYKITKNEELKKLIDEMIDVYLSIDKVELRVQTHCTLTAARGMLRMFAVTSEEKYINGAKEIYDLYVNGGGMTYTYQNLNWWNRPDTWTEPCAIVDSLMIALELYKITGDADYRKTAARIYHNGFATLQRENGGAGTDTLVTADSSWDYLGAQMYEAFFCCTMRLSEGLWYINENVKLLYAETFGNVTKNADGVYCDGDIIYALPDESLLPYAEEIVSVDGMNLAPIVKYYRVPKEIIESAKQKILF